jgi:TPR repeat protein
MKAKIRALFSSLGVFGGVLLYIGLAVAILAAFFSALNVLAAIANVLAAASILILIPLLIIAAVFKRARKFCGTGTLIVSYAWGASTWLTATVYLNDLWGKVAVVIGVFFFGVGSVPLGCLALLLHGRFGPMFMILGQLVFVYILRIMGIWIESTGKPESTVGHDFAPSRSEEEGGSMERAHRPLPNSAREQYEFALRLIDEASESNDVTQEASPEEIAGLTDRLHQRFRSAIRWLRKAAEQGHSEAQLLLGVLLSSGGVFSFLSDPEEAAEWFRKAAEQGLSGAQLALARQYQAGRGVPRDEREAVQWFTKAAEQGDEDAQFALGSMYFAGEGVTQNHEKAAIWVRKSAEQGVAVAQFQLALFYLNGQGVAKDINEAVKWAHCAAAGGCNTAHEFLEDAEAQFDLSLAYLRGDGVEPDAKTAVDWARKAAEQGYAPAQCFLGEAYFFGDGVRENRAEAGEWYRKAARQGDINAQKRLFATEGAVVLGNLQKP